jgi:hypothetical protein
MLISEYGWRAFVIVMLPNHGVNTANKYVDEAIVKDKMIKEVRAVDRPFFNYITLQ